MEENSNLSIGNFEAVELLRKVPEGVLYQAVEKHSGKRVLLKSYYPAMVWPEDVLNEFFNLISYLRFIEHDNLLPILDVGKHEEAPYVVFAGDSTSLLRDRHTPPASRQELIGFFHKLADALDFLHKQEILHGILNTENIVINADGEPKLFDYGLSGIFKKLLPENLEDGFDNLSVSDLKCTSPEQVLGRHPTRASDIYSFGTVFYFYVIGEFPFEETSGPKTAVSLLDSTAVRVSNIPAHVDGNILRFIQKCIQLEPADRYGSFSQVLNILDRLQAGKWTRFRFKKRLDVHRPARHRTISYALGLMVFAGLLSAYFLYPRVAPTPPHPSPTPDTAPQTVSTSPAGKPTATTVPSNPDDPPPAQETASGGETPAPSTQVRSTFKPAVINEKPELPSQVISSSNIGQIREFARLGFGKPEEADAAPDNRHFAVATSAGVFIFDMNQYSDWIDTQEWATSVQFSTNGDVLAIGLNSGEIQLWDWKERNRIGILPRHTGRISRLLFSSTDRLLYSASHDRHVIVWDLNRQSVVTDIPAHSAPVNDIAVTSDGRTLISCSDDQLVRFWDAASGDKFYEFRFDANAVAISSDDAYFAVGGNTGFIRQYSLIDSQSVVNTALQLRTDPIPVRARIWSLDYIDNNNSLLAGIDNGDTKTYNATQLRRGGISAFLIQPPPSDLADIFGPKFKFDAYSTTHGESHLSLRWDGRVLLGQTEILPPMYDILDRLDFSPDGLILSAGGRLGTTNVWDLKTNRVMYQAHYALPFGDPISPDGSSIVVRVTETARITQTGAHIVDESYQQVSLSGASVAGALSEALPNSAVGYARDGSVLVSGNLNISKTWDYLSGYETFSNARKDAGCLITTSKNNGEVLQVISAAGLLPAWDDLARNICAKSLAANMPVVSSDMTVMIFVNSKGQVEGYDPSTRQSPWKFQPPERISALAISPDGTIVAAGSETGQLILLSGLNGQSLATVTGNFAAIRAIEFSEDGIKLAVTGDDGITRLFGIPD